MRRIDARGADREDAASRAVAYDPSVLEDIMLSSNLPGDPDRDAMDRFLVDAYQRVWAGALRQNGPRQPGLRRC